MNLFNLSSAQKMLLFSEINNPNNDSFYLKFRKDYDLQDFEYIHAAIETISRGYLTLQIRHDENGDFKQCYDDVSDVNVETFDVSNDDLGGFVEDYLDNPFDDIFDSPLYKWAVLKTESSTVLIGVVQHILLDGTSLYSIVPQEIEKCVKCIKNNEEYVPIDYSYDAYVDAEIDYLNSPEANSDKQYWLDTLKDYSQDWYSFDDSQLGFLEVLLDEIPKFDYSPFVTSLALSFLYFAKSKKDNKSFNDLVLNTSVHGRYFGQEDALGMFVNTIPLRLAYDEELTFDELLAYSKGVLKEGLGHAKLQFSEYTTDLRNVGIDPDCISMISIVSNSTDHDSKFLTLQKDIKFPLHFRINKNYSDKEGLQSIFIEYDKACFTGQEIESMAAGLKDLLRQVIDDSSKKCKDYDLDVANFFKAENYYNNLINSFAYPTTISPDTNNVQSSFETIYQSFSLEKLKKLSDMYGIRNHEMLLSIFLYNLTKFSFSKDILIAYNSQAAGYHFNTDLSIKQYLNDFKSEFKEFNDYPLSNNRKLNFESEILFDTQGSDYQNYKLIFSVENNYLNLTYDSLYYSPKLIESFLTAFNVLMDKFAESDDLLKDLSILKEVDGDEGFEIDLKNEGIINRIFENAVAQNPDKCILYADDGEFTYSQLNKKANRIANALIKRGLKLEDRVMLIMKRNSDLIATVLGIVKAGGAFIPIDPKYPKNRIDQILEDSDSKFVIVNDDMGFDIENSIDVNELLEENDDSNPDVSITPDNLCFLIYTSGSTGKPKGVMITHRGISNYIAYDERNVPIYELNNRCEKFVSISTVSFIVFLREIFGTIMNGLPVVFANDEQSINPVKLSELFMKVDADGFGSTPTRLLEYLRLTEIQEILKKCNVIIVGGEAFPPVLYDKLSQFTDADIYNSYGPTEVTIASHYKLVDSNVISAGWPMLNVVDKIMDIDGNELPPYVPGEIYVGGAGIARGYLNNSEQTEKVFLTLNGIPYYNTGDLGKKDEHGELYTLGRNDTQIKLRGLRIELSEIEGAIANYEDIMLTKVVVKTINSVDHLCAYYTAASEIGPDDLNEYLENNLPDYMVPSYYTQLDEFPKTPNGKTDFRNLPDPKIVTEHVSAENELEESIFKICAEIMDFDDFGVTDNLYGIGFTSLTMMRLSTEIYNTLGMEINITSILQQPTIRNIAENIDVDEGHDDIIDEFDDDEPKYYELTPNQLGIYFDCVKNSEKVNYNLPKYIDFGSDIDENRLKSAIIKVIDNHPYIKTRIVLQNGVIYQERRDDLIIDDLIEIVDVESIDDEFKYEFVKPFDLSEGPLFRFKIIRNDGNVSLLCDFHHIIVDGTSMNILFRQIASVYDNPDLEFDENDLESLNGFEYSQKETKIQKSRHYKESEMFFFNKIKEHDEGSLISPDLNGVEEDGHASDRSKVIDKEMVDKFCNDASITPNNLFLSISSFVLSKFVNSKSLLFATISNGRFSPDEQNTLAMMVKTLPFSLELDSDLSFKEYFGYVNREWVNTLSYSSYPLTEIVNKYGIVPEFLFAFDGKIIEDIEINGKLVERESLDYDDLKFKLSLNVVEINDDYRLGCQYNDELYSPSLIDTFLDSIVIVLNKLTKFSSEELEHVFLKEISIIGREIPDADELEFIDIGENRLHKIFEKQVESNGDNVILTAADGEFTYNDLNRKANRIAHALIKKGIETEDKIMFILKRNSNVPSSIFGILKAGGAFIPVDSDYPQERIEHVLTDSESKFIIVDDIVDIKGLDLSSCSDKLLDINELLKDEDDSNPDTDVSPENLAYLIYTSGSTGLPKGVMIEHGNFANFIYPHPNSAVCYELVSNAEKENYKMLSLVTMAFDTFLEEMLLTILNGIPVVFADDIQVKDPLKLIPLIEKTNANIFDGTPSRLLQYLEIDGLKELIANFKIFIVGGEGFPKHLHDTLSKVSDGKIFNSYGPTEITVACNDKLINQSNVVSVGGPMLNVYEEIMDVDSNPLPPNVLGELYVAGKGVSRAYYNRPEKNAEVYTTINGIKFYRTGDLAKWDENGEVEILGRLDDQIKLRGLRIEIGEIESAIKEFEGIKALAVVVKKIKGNDHLCAYFTVYDEIKNDEEGYSIDIDALKEHLNSKLTYYMVPTVYMELDEMPQTLNGKTDLRNLPEPVLITEYVAPENDIEAFFADTFADILSLDRVGVTDNFFEIGGTSLLVTKITLAALNRDYEISYGDVFDNPTPRMLSEFLLTDDDSDVSLSDEFDYDYSEINELLKENTLENFIKAGHIDDLGDVLLTGATGFLGIHILRELLENNDGDVYCLVRSKGDLSAEKRLKSLLFYYFSNNYEELFNNRLHVVDGDITDYTDFEKLISYNIDTIFNCAANVKHFSSGTDIEDINFGGVLNGLEFAKLKNSKFVQVSTYSVAGESINNFPPEDYKFNERDLFIGQGIDNQYLRSKFLAERAVLEAAVEDGLSVKIMRVGNLMARSDDGEFQINFVSNGFINRLKAFVTIGQMPYSKMSAADELSPIDVTAKSIVELAKTPKECVVFHPYQHHTICFGDILDIIKPLGFEIEAVEEDEFDASLNRALTDKNKQDGVSGLITSMGSGKFKKVWIDAENEYTIQVLYRLGVKWPIISQEYIYKFIEFLNDLAFFD